MKRLFSILFVLSTLTGFNAQALSVNATSISMALGGAALAAKGYFMEPFKDLVKANEFRNLITVTPALKTVEQAHHLSYLQENFLRNAGAFCGKSAMIVVGAALVIYPVYNYLFKNSNKETSTSGELTTPE